MHWPHQIHTGATLLAVASMLIAACSPAPSAPPAPAQAPPQAAPAQPVAPPPAAKQEPAQPAAPALSAPASAAWDQVLEGAKREGVLSLATGTGTGVQRVVSRFKEKHPWMDVQHSQFKASDLAPRVITEQRNSLYAWDLQIGTGFNTVGSVLAPAGAVADMRPLLSDLPADVKDDSKWAGGFEMYRDPATADSFITILNVAGGVWVNRDQIPASEFTTFDQLLDPKYRGKIVIYNPTQTTGGSQDLAPFLANRGEDFIRKLMVDQKMLIIDNKRQATEWMVTGRYPIGLGMDEEVVEEFQAQGIGKGAEEIRESQSTYLRASGVVSMKNAPHPNASKVFLAWFLSQEGQDSWASMAGPTAVTRRLDVTVYHPKDTPDFTRLGDYKIQTGTPAGDVWLQKVVDIVNEKR